MENTKKNVTQSIFPIYVRRKFNFLSSTCLHTYFCCGGAAIEQVAIEKKWSQNGILSHCYDMEKCRPHFANASCLCAEVLNRERGKKYLFVFVVCLGSTYVGYNE